MKIMIFSLEQMMIGQFQWMMKVTMTIFNMTVAVNHKKIMSMREKYNDGLFSKYSIFRCA